MINQSHTVLIVDDIKENVDVLRNVLYEHYRVKVALSGEKALEILSKEEKPDLILLDVMMPGMNGFEVLRRIKSDTALHAIPVIFVTAKNEVADESQGFELGAADYITKPISPAIVLARVGAHIGLHEQRKQLMRQNNELHKLVRILEHKISRVKLCKTPSEPKPFADSDDIPEMPNVDDFFLEDDKNDLKDIHDEIDSVINMILLQGRIDGEMIQKLGSLFQRYGTKLALYPVFYKLGSGMTHFATKLFELDVQPTFDNEQFSLTCLESLIYTLERWFEQVFHERITDLNMYDNSMISDMETIALALGNEIDTIESDIEFF